VTAGKARDEIAKASTDWSRISQILQKPIKFKKSKNNLTLFSSLL
jgi:hypothetical protein